LVWILKTKADKKKFANYSENNTNIAIRNAGLERACRETVVEKQRIEKENGKLRERIARLEGQLFEQRQLSQNSNCTNNTENVKRSSTASKRGQLKITKYLKAKPIEVPSPKPLLPVEEPPSTPRSVDIHNETKYFGTPTVILSNRISVVEPSAMDAKATSPQKTFGNHSARKRLKFKIATPVDQSRPSARSSPLITPTTNLVDDDDDEILF